MFRGCMNRSQKREEKEKIEEKCKKEHTKANMPLCSKQSIILLVVPKPLRAEVLDKGFGPPIYLLVGFRTILQENGCKHKLDSPISTISVSFWNNNPFPFDYSSPLLTLSLFSLFPSFPQHFFLTTPNHLPSLPLYSLSP